MLYRSLLAALLLATLSAGEDLRVELVNREVVQRRLEAGQVDAKSRQGAIRELFAQAGCAAEEQQVNKKSANVICTLAGQTATVIVAGAHYDFVNRGQGIIDDWSGASLLPSLYQALKRLGLRHTYVFVAFTGEEQGLVGSSRYVKRLSVDQKTSTHAFVNLECLGLAPTKVWESHSNPVLVGRLREVGAALQLPVQAVNVDRVAMDDAVPFLKVKIPVVSIHSITQETLRMLHTDRDRLSAIRPDDYYKAYQLVAFYLAYLDSRLE